MGFAWPAAGGKAGGNAGGKAGGKAGRGDGCGFVAFRGAGNRLGAYSKGPPIRNFTYKKGCTMFCGRWLRKFVQGKRVGFLATMVLLLCGRQHQPLPIGPGRA